LHENNLQILLFHRPSQQNLLLFHFFAPAKVNTIVRDPFTRAWRRIFTS
jgi:hypothetical protein